MGEQGVARVGVEQAAHGQSAFGRARLRRAGVAQVGFVFDGCDVIAQMAFGQRAQRGNLFLAGELARHHEALLAQDGYLIIRQ
ncbi:hypothetical protein D3C72_2427700 [compost metagenome]